MMKNSFFLLLILLLPCVMVAQEPDTLAIPSVQDNMPSVVIVADDLESDDQSQDIAGLLSSSTDIFTSTAGYVFGQTRFKVRGYESRYTGILINGVTVNDRETGAAYWSNWGGLNDATRNKEIGDGIASSTYGFGGPGGITNIETRASSFSEQTKLTYSLTNRAYRNRLMFLISSGLKENGWSYAVSGSRRWAQEGYVEGTFYDAWSYFATIEKKINKIHSIGLVAYGAPTKRGRDGVSVQEAYDLAGTNYYNPSWGFQNGEKRNSRVANYHQPMFILNHYFTPEPKTKITSSVSYAFGRGGSTALDWYDAPDPRPDYYRLLPSDEREYYGMTSAQREELWRNDETFRQLDFDYFYFVNRKNLFTFNNADGIEGNNVTGNLSNYIIEDRRNDKSHLSANINLVREVNEHVKFSSGLDLSWFKTYQFKVVEDLLGGDFYLDIDKFAERDFIDPILAQNDLNNPNRVVRVGDKFGYDYTGNINNYNLFAQGDFTYGKMEYYITGTVSFDEFWRTGHMRNGKFPEDSYGDSEKHQFFNYGLKGGVTYKITGRHLVNANAIYLTQAPYFRDSYVSPRTRNQTIDDLTSEKILSGDLSYIYRSPYLKARGTVYYISFTDQVYSRSFYHETYRSFVNYQMTGVDKIHVGAEVGLDAKVSQNFSLNGVLATGDYYYNSRPTATISVDNDAEVLGNRTIYLKDYKVGGFPQTAMSFGVKYSSSSYIFAGASINYYDEIYLEINPDRRSAEAVANYSPDYPERQVILDQERLDAAYTIDAYVGKSWRIDYKYFISVNLSVSNLLDMQDLAFGGFEQYRYDPYDIDKFPPKYFYMYGRQFFLNINFRF